MTRNSKNKHKKSLKYRKQAGSRGVSRKGPNATAYMYVVNKVACVKVRKEGKEAYSSLCYKHRTGTPVPYWITQCYLPPGRGNIPAFTPAG